MKIRDDQMLEIYMVCPKNEDVYTRRTKVAFLDGKLDCNLKLDPKTTVTPPELDAMWRNTKLFVIRPKADWQPQIDAYIATLT